MADEERQEPLAAKQTQKRRGKQKRQEEEEEKKTKKKKRATDGKQREHKHQKAEEGEEEEEQKPKTKTKRRRERELVETVDAKTGEGKNKSKRARSKRPAKAPKDTVWAYVLDQQEAGSSDAPTYKLRRNFAEYPAATNVGHLAKSVEDVLYESGYFRPDKTRIYRNNPFEGEPVVDDDDNKLYHLKAGVNKLDNSKPISDADREATQPFYVLVSKLRERQPAMDVVAAPSPAPQATTEIIEQIFHDRLHNNTLTLRPLGSIERFRLPKRHSFANKVNALDLPVYPYRAEGQPATPHLIMDGLLQPGEGVRFVSEDSKKNILDLLQNGAAAILGVSGSGKTRTILEILAERWGLLFIIDTQSNGGIKDFGPLRAYLRRALSDPLQQDLSRATRQHKKDKQVAVRSANEDKAIHAVSCLLLARLMVLDSLVQTFPEQMNPLTWLWIQLYPRYMLTCKKEPGVNVDALLGDLVSHLIDAELPPNVVLSAIREKMSAIAKRLALGESTQLPCFVDEAQVLLTTFPGHFPSHDPKTNGDSRALFSIFRRAWESLVGGPVFSGTSMDMKAAMEALASAAVGKVPLQTPPNQLYTDLPYLKGADCLAYLSRYINLRLRKRLTRRQQDDIVRMVSGRARLSAQYVGFVLTLQSTKLLDELERFVRRVTEVPSEAERDSKTNFQAMIDELFHKLYKLLEAQEAPTIDYDNIRSTFRQLCIRYALTGLPQVVESQRIDYLDFIDAGICRLRREQGESHAVIDEQMMVIAACNHFGLKSYQWELCAAVADEPSSLGYQFERTLMLMIESGTVNLFGDNAVPLQRHPLLRGLKLPKHFKGKWRLDKSHGPLNGGTIGRVASSKQTLASWIRNPTSIFFLPDKHAGPDLVFFIVNNKEERVLVLLQAKLKTKYLSAAGAEKAESKTDVEEFYTFSTGGVVQTRQADRNAILGFYDNENLRSIGILAVYPADLAAGVTCSTQLRHGGRDLFIAAVGDSFKHLVPADVIADLDALKEPL